MLVEYPRCLTARVDDLEKLFEEARCLERELPVVFVDVEHAALCSCVRRGFRFVDGRGDTVNVEDARKHQASKPGTDDCDWSPHLVSFMSQRAAAF